MADFKIGQRLTHTCSRTGIMPVEFRGFHQHAETGARVARVIFRPENGPPFEASVDPAELSPAKPWTVFDWTRPGLQDQSAAIERAKDRLGELREEYPDGNFELTHEIDWNEIALPA